MPRGRVRPPRGARGREERSPRVSLGARACLCGLCPRMTGACDMVCWLLLSHQPVPVRSPTCSLTNLFSHQPVFSPRLRPACVRIRPPQAWASHSRASRCTPRTARRRVTRSPQEEERMGEERMRRVSGCLRRYRREGSDGAPSAAGSRQRRRVWRRRRCRGRRAGYSPLEGPWARGALSCVALPYVHPTSSRLASRAIFMCNRVLPLHAHTCDICLYRMPACERGEIRVPL